MIHPSHSPRADKTAPPAFHSLEAACVGHSTLMITQVENSGRVPIPFHTRPQPRNAPLPMSRQSGITARNAVPSCARTWTSSLQQPALAGVRV